MNNKIGMHCYVRGKVQGVWFRANTKDEADKLGLTGWVRNLSDGSVEVTAYGSPEQIEKLHVWLQVGPPRAQVTEVKREEVMWEEFSDFEILY